MFSFMGTAREGSYGSILHIDGGLSVKVLKECTVPSRLLSDRVSDYCVLLFFLVG
jgi:hypothetical protein